MSAATSACDTTDGTPLEHVLAGARAMMPWLIGVAPLGVVVGVSAAQADAPTFAGWLTGPLVFSGSAQLAVIQLLDGGAEPVVAVIAALAVNVRLVLYSATMARHWRGSPRWWQALAAALLVDPTLSVGVAGYERTRTQTDGHLHYTGGAVALLLAWIAAITFGATVGTALPAWLHLEYVIPLFLVGEVLTRLSNRRTRHAAGTAAVLGAVGTCAPLHLGVLLAIAGGLAVAVLAERTTR